jgi:alpha-tubulin suppressor-like RCC1 family protein
VAFAQGPGNTTLSFPAPVQLLEAANTPIDRVCQIEGTLYGVVMVRSDVIGGSCAANEPRSVWYTANISFNEPSNAAYVVRYGALDSGGALLPAGRWIKDVVTSRDHGSNQNSVFAIANDGTVYAWGFLNGRGQLGLGNDNTQPSTPQLASGWQGALKITAAGEVTLALMPDGSIKGAGWNPSASLGIGPVSFTSVSTPTTLAGIAGATDVSTASSNSGSMALVGGQLRYWGSNPQFDAATQVSPIAIVAPATPLTSVSVGGYHAVAIGPGGAVYSWGHPSYRGCATNSAACNATTTVPTLVTLP